MVSGGKRPGAKLKVMAKLGENLYRTTKIFRFCENRLASVGMPKPKWQAFLSKNSAQRKAWQEWWDSPQSQRWKDIEKPKLKQADDGQ
jgi:hypothetical protein